MKNNTTKTEGITILDSDAAAPSDAVCYVPEFKVDVPYYKTKGMAVAVCKRLMKTDTWILGSSFEGFYVQESPYRKEDGFEKTWFILFN